MATSKPKKFCRQPPPVEQPHEPGIDARRMRYILASNKKWLNGTELKYMFLEGATTQRDVVRKAFKQWKDLGIGLTFKEVGTLDEAILRIGFDQHDGSWSYVGRDNLTIPANESTMNFGWRLDNAYGMTTALHEIGHALGFQHEHQSPFTGIEWNMAAVRAYFSGPPNNWSAANIEHNILRKLGSNTVEGSNWDPTSIMEYEFGPGLVVKPEQFNDGIYPPGILSPADVAGVKKFYPPKPVIKVEKLQVGISVPIAAATGEQADFIFKAPYTRKYSIQTTGSLDTVMVLYEKDGTQLYYLAGDDDSGYDKNSRIRMSMVRNREYKISVRVLYSSGRNKGYMLVS
ncbi:MAG: M12 family metallopeptidase [Pseudomonadota bacterium]